MIALALSLLAAVSWGVSDFVGGLAARRATALATVLIAFPLGAIGFALLAPLAGGSASPATLWLSFACGVLSAFGVLWFYAALATGPMSVVSPLTALLVAGLPLLAGLLLGERPGSVALAGAGLAVAAVVLVSWEDRSAESSAEGSAESGATHLTARALGLTIGAGAAYAGYFVVLDRVPADSGLWPLVVSRAVGSVLVVLACLAGRRLRLLTGVPARLALAAGVLDVVANVAFLYALRAGLLTLVSVLTALYPAATVLLARLVLGERTSLVQRLGLGLAVVAVALIATGS